MAVFLGRDVELTMSLSHNRRGPGTRGRPSLTLISRGWESIEAPARASSLAGRSPPPPDRLRRRISGAASIASSVRRTIRPTSRILPVGPEVIDMPTVPDAASLCASEASLHRPQGRSAERRQPAFPDLRERLLERPTPAQPTQLEPLALTFHQGQIGERASVRIRRGPRCRRPRTGPTRTRVTVPPSLSC